MIHKAFIRLEGTADELAERYCNERIVPFAFKMDALHIAVATLWKADALVSYNFEHIVSLEVMVRAFNSPLQRRIRQHMTTHLALKVAVTALRSEIFNDISGYLAQV